MDIGSFIEPFWKRLHKCFVYPLSSLPSAALIFGLALLSSFFSAPGLFAAIIRFVLWAVMVKYAYEALRTTAEGRLTPPPLSGNTISGNYQIVFKQIGLFIALLLLLVFLIGPLGPIAWVLFGLAMVIGLPSMIIILAINDDLGKALNPFFFIGMAIRIGWGYLLLFFFLTILLSAPGVLGYYVIRHMPEGLQLFLSNAAQNYYTLVSYHLMGYVILQYHDKVGHHVNMDTLLASASPGGMQSDLNAAQQENNSQNPLLNEISPLVRDGNLDEAIDLIKDRTNLEINDLDLSDRFIKLLEKRQRIEELLEYAPGHLDLLAKAGRSSEVVELYSSCIKKSENFSPSAATLFKIGGWLNENGRTREAVRAFNQLIKTYPGNALVPKTCYRAAQLLHEQLGYTEKSRKLLQAMIRKYPDHDMARFARNYLATM